MNSPQSTFHISHAVLARAIATVQALQAGTRGIDVDVDVDVWLAALIELRNRMAHGLIEIPPEDHAVRNAAEFLMKIELSSLGNPDAADWQARSTAELVDTVDRLSPWSATPEDEAPDQSVDTLVKVYQENRNSLLRLAALLLDDLSSCEDVLQEAFIRVHAFRSRVHQPEELLTHLRQTVVNLSRTTLRKRLIGLRLLPKPSPHAASAEEGAYDLLERDALVQALRNLPRRQREVLVLRYYSDMNEAQVAASLGLSIGSVKAYGSRGIDALRVQMEMQKEIS